MYKKFYGLRQNPFGVNPDPRFLYRTRDIKESLACLAYGIQRRKGFMLLTGEVGTGKTTLLNHLLGWSRRWRVSSSFITNPRLTVTEFLDFMMLDFGVSVDSPLKSRVLIRLNQWLLERYRLGETAAVIIDEGQNLSMELLEEIRLLTNLETSTEKLLQIVLCGQPELERKLSHPQLRQLRQRISLRCKTSAFTHKEAEEYVRLRLRIAGANGAETFAPGALDALLLQSQGIPRVINVLCEHSLIAGYAEQVKPISGEIVERVLSEFDPVTLGLRTGQEGFDQTSPPDPLQSLAVLLDRLRRLE